MSNSKYCLCLLVVSLLTGLAIPASAFDRDAMHERRYVDYPPERQATVVVSNRTARPAAQTLANTAVSESVSPARFEQENGTLIATAGGGWLAAWEDDREGVDKIFWQVFSAPGMTVGGNELKAGSAVGDRVVDAQLAIDSSGDIYLFYRDQGRGMIFGSRYQPDGSPDIAPFLINDTSFNSFAGPFDVALYPDGRTVVAWENSSGLGSTITARIIDAAGNPVTAPFVVNSDGGSSAHWVPSVAVEAASGFLIAWEDYRNGNADIYARLFSGAGTALGNDFSIVPSPSNAADQYTPEVLFVTADLYVLAWIDQRSGQDVFVQAYNTNSGLSGGNVQVSAGGATSWDAHLSLFGPDDIAVIWASFTSASSINYRRFDSALNPTRDIMSLVSTTVGQHWSPSLAPAGDSSFALLRTDIQNEQADAVFELFDSSGAAVAGSKKTVNDDVMGAVSSDPDLSVSADHRALYVYADQRSDAGDIFVKNIDIGLEPFRSSWRVNQDPLGNLQSEPAVSAVRNAEAIITWIDSRIVGGLSGQRIFARYCDPSSFMTEDEFVVSDSLQAGVKSSVDAVMLGNGRALIVWIDQRTGNREVMGRWLAADHSLDGAEMTLSGTSVSVQSGTVKAEAAGDGSLCVGWLDPGSTPPTVRGIWYNSDKSTAATFAYAPSSADTTIEEIALAARPGKELVLLWRGAVLSNEQLLMTVLNSTGMVVTPSVEITDVTNVNAGSPSVSIDEQGYVVSAWIDERSGGPDVYQQVFDAGLAPIGSNATATSSAPGFALSPVTGADRGRAWFGWVDPRANGLTVYAGLSIYLQTDAGDEPGEILPTDFVLEQNYPNPFNPSTTIAFTLPTAAEANLTVFNVLGRRIARLAEGRFAAGRHTLVWDGRDDRGRPVASGVYFYRLTVDGSVFAKKMVLLK